MDVPGGKREVRNIMEYSSGLIVCLDQNCKRIDAYFGPKEKILPLLREEDLSKARIKRMVPSGKRKHPGWEMISQGKFLANCR
ncbi:MAG: hypothetical protein R3231_03605 [bacterium]|nr:hypothetical protein [bacterium]